MAKNYKKFECYFCLIPGMDYLCAKLIPGTKERGRPPSLLLVLHYMSLYDHAYLNIIC